MRVNAGVCRGQKSLQSPWGTVFFLHRMLSSEYNITVTDKARTVRRGRRPGWDKRKARSHVGTLVPSAFYFPHTVITWRIYGAFTCFLHCAPVRSESLEVNSEFQQSLRCFLQSEVWDNPLDCWLLTPHLQTGGGVQITTRPVFDGSGWHASQEYVQLLPGACQWC